MAVSDDRLAVTKTTNGWWDYASALVEPAFDSAVGRTYAEWSLDQTSENCHVLLGVTALETAPRGNGVQSRLIYCHNSSLHPRDSAPASWDGRGRRLRQGDRVGLLVEGGRAWVDRKSV